VKGVNEAIEFVDIGGDPKKMMVAKPLPLQNLSFLLQFYWIGIHCEASEYDHSQLQ
jgi:hypothetical protein